MKRNMKFLSALLCSAFALAFFSSLARAERHNDAIVVVQPLQLPESAQAETQSMYLRPGGDGVTYLYMEQQQLKRIVVLDVSAPDHIKHLGFVPLKDSAAFDFVRPLGTTAALVCFRDNSGSGIIDFRKPKEPILTAAPGLRQAARAEELGPAGLLVVNDLRTPNDQSAHDMQIIDLSMPRAPKVLATVRGVHQQVTDNATGARFLLGAEGLTVVRQPHIEERHELEMTANN